VVGAGVNPSRSPLPQEQGERDRAGFRFRYAAFISYSHSASGRLAPAVQRGLRQLGKPWFRPPDLAVYRDQTSLSATPALWPAIEQALSASRFFLLLASQDAAASPWVSKEVTWWLQHSSSRHILLALTDGEICWDSAAGDFDRRRTTAVPDCLFGVFDDEPKWVDLRWAETPERLTLRHPAFRDCVADLAAPIRGVTKEALVDEDVRQQRRRIRWRNAAISGLAVLSVVACILAVLAVNQRNTARRQRDVATSRQLAALSGSVQSTQPDLAPLLALEAVHRRPTEEAWAAVQAALSQPVHASWRLVGHTDVISDVAMSRDGRLAATSGGNGEVFVWRVADGARVLGPLDHGDAIVYSVDISPDGTLIATGGTDETVRLWRTSDGVAALDALQVGDSVNSVSFSPDGATLVTGDNGGNIRLWDTATGRETGSVLADPAGVTKLEYLSTVDEILSAGFSGDVRRWDTSTLQPVGTTISAGTPGTYGGVRSFSVRADGRLLATVADDGQVRLWDLPTGLPHEPAHLEATGVRAVAFSPDGKQLATVSSNIAQLWDVTTGREIAPAFHGSTDYLLDVAFSADGLRLVTGGGDQHPRIWDVATSQPIGRPLQVSDAVFDVALAPDGQSFAAASSGQVSVHDLDSGEARLAPFRAAPGGTTAAYSPDGSLLAVGDIDGVARLWRLATQEQVGPELSTGFDIYDMAFSPDSGKLATAGFDGSVWLWDATTGRQLRELTPPGDDAASTSGLASLALDPSGAVVAGADLDGPVHLWELASGRVIASLDQDDEASTAVAFSPDGHQLAQGTSEGELRIWDVDTRRVICTLTGHERWVEAAAFAPNGQLLATGAQDSSVQLWDPIGCRSAAASITGFRDDVTAVQFSADGRELAMSSLDGTVRTAITPSEWSAAACDLARRNMSEAEWARYLDEPYRRTCPQWR
jgi:WD40 repeat protein